LADRGELAATPAVLALAEKGDVAVRVAAIEALAKLGNSGMAVLLSRRLWGKRRTGHGRCAALGAMPDRDLDVCSDGRSVTRTQDSRLAAEVLGNDIRRALRMGCSGATADTDKAVRQAAIKALGATVKLRTSAGCRNSFSRPPTR